MAPQWLRAPAVEGRLAGGSATSVTARGTAGGVKGAMCPNGPNDHKEDAMELQDVGVSLAEAAGPAAGFAKAADFEIPHALP